MKDSKNLAMMFLLGTFLTGGALGFTANRYMNRERICTTDRVGASLLDIMAARLQLSDTQVARVDSILDERGRQYRIVMAPIQPRMDSIKLNARAQIRRVLSAEQNQGFEALITEMNDTTKNVRKE
ncbi:MAG: hypothetical protein ABIZ91_10015 [Gemmatimonadaceae bacterium]